MKFLKFLLRIGYVGLCFLWGGWVLLTLWGWYLQPLVGHALTLKQAIGIDLFLSLITIQYIPRDMPVRLGEAAKLGWTHDHIVLVYAAVAPATLLGWGAFFRWVLP